MQLAWERKSVVELSVKTSRSNSPAEVIHLPDDAQQNKTATRQRRRPKE